MTYECELAMLLGEFVSILASKKVIALSLTSLDILLIVSNRLPVLLSATRELWAGVAARRRVPAAVGRSAVSELTSTGSSWRRIVERSVSSK